MGFTDGAGACIAGQFAGERLGLRRFGAQQRDGVAAGQGAGGDATGHVAGADDRDVHEMCAFRFVVLSCQQHRASRPGWKWMLCAHPCTS
jgi:hypothetical protein